METAKARSPKKVLCIMDLSCVGRAGLAAALPVLSACGVQACALPAALFSSHTGGFGSVQRLNAAAFGEEALNHWLREGVCFDAVYTGYLYGEAQFALARRAFARYPGALRVTDPALGDDGAAYGGLGADTVDAMRGLAAEAGLITPNYTESALLLGLAPSALPPCKAEAAERLRQLAYMGGAGQSGPRNVIITSVPLPGGGFVTLGRSAAGEAFSLPSRRVPRRYPGTGDLFCAALLGLLLRRGATLKGAARRAAAFTERAAAAAFAAQSPAREGLPFEPFLPLLAARPRAQKAKTPAVKPRPGALSEKNPGAKAPGGEAR